METFFISLLHKEYKTKFENFTNYLTGMQENLNYADDRVKKLSNLLHKKYTILKEIKNIKKPSSIGDFSTEEGKKDSEKQENPLTKLYKELEEIEEKIKITSKEVNYFFEILDQLSALISQTNSSIQTSVSKIYESWIEVIKEKEA